MALDELQINGVDPVWWVSAFVLTPILCFYWVHAIIDGDPPPKKLVSPRHIKIVTKSWVPHALNGYTHILSKPYLVINMQELGERQTRISFALPTLSMSKMNFNVIHFHLFLESMNLKKKEIPRSHFPNTIRHVAKCPPGS